MREIKFRAWDEKNEAMVTDFYVNGHGAHNCVNGQHGAAFRFDKDGPFFCPKLFVMQFTGILDSNGTEIYEGDVVKFSVKGGFVGVGEVKTFPEFGITGIAANFKFGYNKADSSMPVGSSGSSTPYKPYTWKSYKTIKVIGNIYQNPELLKCTES